MEQERRIEELLEQLQSSQNALGNLVRRFYAKALALLTDGTWQADLTLTNPVAQLGRKGQKRLTRELGVYKQEMIDQWILQAKVNSGDLGRHIADHEDLVKKILIHDRQGICLRCEEAGPILEPAYEESLLQILERSIPVASFLKQLLVDHDKELAKLVQIHKEFTYDRLLFTDMRDMSAIVQDGQAILTSQRRQTLMTALIDQDLAKRLCNKGDQTEWNSAWSKATEKYHGLLWFLINRHPMTQNIGEADKQDIFQRIWIELTKAVERYDARQASLATFLTVVANRVCGHNKIQMIHGFWDEVYGEDFVQPVEDRLFLNQLLERALELHVKDEKSRQIYRYVFWLKLSGWPSKKIAIAINQDLIPDPPLTSGAVDVRWNELKKWMCETAMRDGIINNA